VFKFGQLLDYADNKITYIFRIFASYYKNQWGKNGMTELPDHRQKGLYFTLSGEGAAHSFDILLKKSRLLSHALLSVLT
jgi:hypothetical protein